MSKFYGQKSYTAKQLEQLTLRGKKLSKIRWQTIVLVTEHEAEIKYGAGSKKKKYTQLFSNKA